ncbi:MAG: HU family DNA-binding protein, partial [Prevotella sp.]
MINYSIVMRGVNANLFEINQAKSRIKKAIEDGKEPAEADTELVKTEVQKAYAIAQYTDVMNIEKFARHIASHGSVYSRADIAAILYLMVDCMREQLLEGKKIRLGDLGDFSLILTSRGADSADKFSAQNITGVNVVWEPGMEFKSLLADAEFNLVASRNAQAALLKAIKAGQSVVDITQPVTPDDPTDTPSGDDNGGSGSDSGSDSG